jgi:hypothetical protein
MELWSRPSASDRPESLAKTDHVAKHLKDGSFTIRSICGPSSALPTGRFRSLVALSRRTA